MAVSASLPQLGTIIVAAAVDSINPCAIGVLILLISTLVATSQSKRRMLYLGLVYIAAVYVTYFLAGIGLILFFTLIPQAIAEYISIAIAAIIVFSSLVEIKDFYWYGQGFTLAIAPDKAKKIQDYAKNLSLPGMVFLGAFVAAVELPCTGGPYLAITLILRHQFNLAALGLMVIYNFIFVLPLIILLLLALLGTKATELKKWKDTNRAYMRLLMGLLMIALGWVLIFIANGTINFG